MKRRMHLGRVLVIIAFAGAALATVLILNNQVAPTTAESTNPHKITGVTQADYGRPVRITIPKINVDAPVDQMGLTTEGDMQAPTEPHHVGWYKHGSHPGNAGSAVIAGHYGRLQDGRVSAFDMLHTLSKGDLIHTKDETGAIAVFKVQDVRSYTANEDATRVFTSNDGKAHLNLITCQGAWDPSEQTYSHRLVVFTTKE